MRSFLVLIVFVGIISSHATSVKLWNDRNLANPRIGKTFIGYIPGIQSPEHYEINAQRSQVSSLGNHWTLAGYFPGYQTNQPEYYKENQQRSQYSYNIDLGSQRNVNSCDPSQCGYNAQCRFINGDGACTCNSGFFGNPYQGCRPECLVSSECPQDQVCVSTKCIDPSQQDISNQPEVAAAVAEEDPCEPIRCGYNAKCQAFNGEGVCICNSGFFGDPYMGCRPECVVSSECPNSQVCKFTKCVDPSKDDSVSEEKIIEPCDPSPCGYNAQCQSINGKEVCTCSPGLVGDPLVGCRPECLVSDDCSSHQACVSTKCVDPCQGSCGENAECEVTNHQGTCRCLQGYQGNPYISCQRVTLRKNAPRTILLKEVRFYMKSFGDHLIQKLIQLGSIQSSLVGVGDGGCNFTATRNSADVIEQLYTSFRSAGSLEGCWKAPLRGEVGGELVVTEGVVPTNVCLDWSEEEEGVHICEVEDDTKLMNIFNLKCHQSAQIQCP